GEARLELHRTGVKGRDGNALDLRHATSASRQVFLCNAKKSRYEGSPATDSGTSSRRSGWRARAMDFDLRRVGCGVILLGIFLAVVAPPARPAGAVDQVPRKIDGYVLFALDRLNFKGRNTSGGVILGGNVGVNNVDPHDPPMPRLTFGGPTFMP